MNQNLLQLGRQLLGIWRQLGLNQRISVVLATAAVLAGLLGVAFWSHRVEYSLLYGRLDDAEAAKVIAALEADKTPYQISRGGGAISVPADKVHAVRMQLAGRGIPKGEGVGFEIFDKPNFGISDFVQRANYLRAVQGELARTIGQLDEVETARVMIVMPENRLLADQTKKPTASVFIKVKNQAQLAAPTVNSIRFLVANAVEGLQVHNVSVVDNRGNVLSETTEPDSLAGLTASQLSVRRQLELYLSKKAESMLEAVLGPGRALVRVAAELNFDTLTKTQEVYEPDGALREDMTKEEKTDSSTGSASVAAGSTTNTGSNTNAAPGAPMNNSKNTSITKSKKYEIGKTTSSTLQQPGSVKRLSAAVFVAKRVEGAGANRKEVALTPKERESLTKLVKSALGLQENQDGARQDEITLEEWSFNDQTTVELGQQLEKQQQRQFWWELAKSLIYPLLALAVLWVFWRAVKKTPVETIPIGIPLGHLAPGGTGNGHNGKNGFGRGNGHGAETNRLPWEGQESERVVTVEVLNQLIKENPANMTQAVRAWLTRGKSTTR